MEGIFLDISTTEKETGIAFVQGQNVLHELIVETEAKHNETLFTFLDESFKKLNLRAKDLSGIGVILGPGMFTSIRVGLACAKGLAIVNNIPIKGFNTLDALAFSLPENILKQDKTIMPVIDVRRNEVYFRAYQGLKPITGPEIIKAEQLAEKIVADSIVLGSGIIRYLELVKSMTQKKFMTYNLVVPNPTQIAFHAQECIEQNDYSDIEKLVPFYVR